MRNRTGACALIAALALALAACGGAGTRTEDFDAGASAVKRGVKPEPDAEAAVVETDFGRIVIELYPNVAPRMVERFKTLAREGFYDGTTFHRVERFVIQGGDPNSKDADPSNDGQGGSPYPDVPDEFSDLAFEPGVVGAARAGYNTANSQFYITLTPMPAWEGEYTAFGRVIEGLGNARIISGAPTRAGSTNPDPKVVIKRVTLQPRADFQKQ